MAEPARRYLGRRTCLQPSLPARFTSGLSLSEERADAQCPGDALVVHVRLHSDSTAHPHNVIADLRETLETLVSARAL